MKNKLFTLPNSITLANLACGCAATVYALAWYDPKVVFWLVAAAAVFDFSDGIAARLTKQYSEIGKQLDSLADLVSFGVAPSAVLFTTYRLSAPLWSEGMSPALSDTGGLAVFVVAIFSALRLAKFNVDDNQKDTFTGLPTPAAGLTIAALGWMWYNGRLEVPREAILLVAVAVSCLLVSPLRMFSLKFAGMGWRGNEVRYVFLASSLVLVALMGVGGVPVAVALYVVASVVRPEKWLTLRRK